MKIAYFNNDFNNFGGAEKITIVKANALAERGHELLLVVTDSNPQSGYVEPISHKVKLVHLDVNYYEMGYTIYRHLKKMWRHRQLIKRFIKEEQPDIIVSLCQWDRLIMPTIRHHNSVFIREIHFNSLYKLIDHKSGYIHFLQKIKLFIEYRLFGHRWNRIVLLTEDDLQNSWTGPKDNTIVIPNPISVQPIVSKLTEKVVVSVGRLVSQKNHQQLIRAFSKVVELHSDWQLRIFGEGNERDELQQLILDLHIEHHVTLMGNSLQIPRELSQASIFALSSTHEGLPLCVIEALACGLPVVATNVTGTHSILSGYDCGTLVPLDDHEAMAKAICHLIEHPEERLRIQQNALKRAQDFELSNIIDQWERLFKELVNENKK